jgi:hypothetical protein
MSGVPNQGGVGVPNTPPSSGGGGGAPTGPAGGVLSGTYPNPGVAPDITLDGLTTFVGGVPTDTTPVQHITQTWSSNGQQYVVQRFDITKNGTDYNTHLVEYWHVGSTYPFFFIDKDGFLGGGGNSPYVVCGVNAAGRAWSTGFQDTGQQMGVNAENKQGFMIRADHTNYFGWGQNDSADKPMVAALNLQDQTAPVIDFTNGTALSQGGSPIGQRVAFTEFMPVATPAAPAAGYRMFTDTADGVLKVIDSTGTIKTVTLL